MFVFEGKTERRRAQERHSRLGSRLSSHDGIHNFETLVEGVVLRAQILGRGHAKFQLRTTQQ
jgi:hypothetical protein